MDYSDLYKKYLDSALHFLSYRPRSEKEVRDYLEKKSVKGGTASGGKAPEEIIEKIIARLREQRFLNDEDFARWWMEQRSRFRPKGIRIIQLELKQKGIPQEIIEKLKADTEGQLVSDLESAKKIVEKKLPKYKGLKKREIYQKLGAALARKGFDWETIKKAIDDSAK